MQATEMEYAGTLLEECSHIEELSNEAQKVDSNITSTFQCNPVLTIYCC